MMRPILIVALFWALSAYAQDQGVQRALILRDQQSAAFGLQLRQSQEVLGAPPASRATLESRQLRDRQQLYTLHEKQVLEVKPDTSDVVRPYERQKADVESRPFRYPVVEVPVRRPTPPPPLQPSLKGNVDMIEAPR